jgi:hypothetical protein
MNTILDPAVDYVFRRHGHNLPIDQLRALSLALAFAPGEVFVDSHRVAKGDVHAAESIMGRGFGAKR